MLDIRFKLDVSTVDALIERLSDRAIGNIVEAITREHLLKYLREFSLDANKQAPPPARNLNRQRLRKVTGVLESSVSLSSRDNGLTQIINVGAEYAIFHHGPGTRDVFNKAADNQKGIMRRSFSKALTELIKG